MPQFKTDKRSPPFSSHLPPPIVLFGQLSVKTTFIVCVPSAPRPKSLRDKLLFSPAIPSIGRKWKLSADIWLLLHNKQAVNAHPALQGEAKWPTPTLAQIQSKGSIASKQKRSLETFCSSLSQESTGHILMGGNKPNIKSILY